MYVSVYNILSLLSSNDCGSVIPYGIDREKLKGSCRPLYAVEGTGAGRGAQLEVAEGGLEPRPDILRNVIVRRQRR